MNQLIVKQLQQEIKSLKNSLYISEQKMRELEEEIKSLKVNNKENIKNERGAGRKSKFTDEEKETIRMYRLQGKTMQYIADMFDCSVGLVHKIVNEIDKSNPRKKLKSKIKNNKVKK